MMNFLGGWLWPLFAFTFPMLFFPQGSGGLSSILQQGYLVRAAAIAVFVLVGLVIEWKAHPNLRLTDVTRLPGALIQHPPLLLGLGFGLWVLIAAQFALEPNTALLGSLYGAGEGALFAFGLVLVFTLSYLAILREPQVAWRITWAVLASGALMGLLALLEVGLHRGLFYKIHQGSLPMLTYPQKGHLAGYFVLISGVMLGVLYGKQSLNRKQQIWLWLSLLVLATAMGTTTNRAALVSLAVALLVGATSLGQKLRIAMVVGVGFAMGYGWLQLQATGGSRQLSDSTSSSIRLYYWKAAVGGIMDRPLLGWGTGGFDQVWPKYLSKADLNRVAQLEFKVKEVLSYTLTPGANPVLVAKDENGRVKITGVSIWKAHNQYLDMSLLRGLPGLLLYLGLLYWAIQGARWYPPAVGMLAYHLFLLFWFAPFHVEGTLWSLLAVAALAKRPVVVPARPTAEIAAGHG